MDAAGAVEVKFLKASSNFFLGGHGWNAAAF